MTCDRVRRELICRVQNSTSLPGESPIHGETYGGIEIMKALVRLFEWQSPAFESSAGQFVVSWRIPVSERGTAGQAD